MTKTQPIKLVPNLPRCWYCGRSAGARNVTLVIHENGCTQCTVCQQDRRSFKDALRIYVMGFRWFGAGACVGICVTLLLVSARVQKMRANLMSVEPQPALTTVKEVTP